MDADAFLRDFAQAARRVPGVARVDRMEDLWRMEADASELGRGRGPPQTHSGPRS